MNEIVAIKFLSFEAQACNRANFCTLESSIMHCEIVVCRLSWACQSAPASKKCAEVKDSIQATDTNSHQAAGQLRCTQDEACAGAARCLSVCERA